MNDDYPQQAICGGAWWYNKSHAHTSYGSVGIASTGFDLIGFRTCRRWP
jgi:hypothetical protein